MEITCLDCFRPVFPAASLALAEPDGLLAFGGNLEKETLLSAYRQGIFPWFETGQPILWWSPAQRAVFEPGDLHISRSLNKLLRRKPYTVTTDKVFPKVINQCAAPRQSSSGTWITREMIDAYIALHNYGMAHSIEVWLQDELVGGLYGVAIGGVFCGESMFSQQSNTSKIALVSLLQTLFSQGFEMVDCQVSNAHLTSMGSKTISRENFIGKLQMLRDKPCLWPIKFNYL